MAPRGEAPPVNVDEIAACHVAMVPSSTSQNAHPVETANQSITQRISRCSVGNAEIPLIANA